MQININLIVKYPGFKKYNSSKKAFIKRVTKEVLSFTNLFDNTDSLEYTLLLTNNEEMRELNKNFLGKDKVTNILSFPDRVLHYKTISSAEFAGDIELGDIACGLEITESESQDYGISFENHFTHLLVHAILHLLGYDHELEEDFKIMQELEVTILKKLGINIIPIYAQE